MKDMSISLIVSSIKCSTSVHVNRLFSTTSLAILAA